MRTTSKTWPHLLVGMQFICLIILAWSGPLFATRPLLLLMECVSAGLGVWAIATLQLGRFNITPDIASRAELMRSGPYKFIRHPMYTSLLLASLALILDSFSISRACIWLALLATLVTKLLYEERLLSERFREYEEYKQLTKRLIPFLW